MATTKIEASNIATGAVPSTGFTSVQVFTAASTWTRPTDITKVIVEVQGGGAGGGRSNTATIIQGGSGGGYAKKFIDVSSVTKSVIRLFRSTCWQQLTLQEQMVEIVSGLILHMVDHQM